MSAEEIRARYETALTEQLEIAEPTWIGAGREGEVAADVIDALAAAGLLPDGEEWAIRYEARRATPSMEGKTFDTSTLAVDSEGHARAAIANGVPMSGLNRRIVSRPAFEWREASTDE